MQRLEYTPSAAVTRVTIRYTRAGGRNKPFADTNDAPISLAPDDYLGQMVTVQIQLADSANDLLQDYVGTTQGWQVYGRPRRTKSQLPPEQVDLERLANRAVAITVQLVDNNLYKLPSAQILKLALKVQAKRLRTDRPAPERLDCVATGLTQVTVQPTATFCEVWAYFDHLPPRQLKCGEAIEMAAVAGYLDQAPLLHVYEAGEQWRIADPLTGQIVGNYPRSSFTRRRGHITLKGVRYRIEFVRNTPCPIIPQP